MKNYVPVLLGAIVSLGLFLGLEPLLTFPVWGSDTGEYYFLTQYLVHHGHLLLQGYSGWGFGYPDFPGMFLLGGSVAESFGVSPLESVIYVIPVIGALSSLPLFLLFRRLGVRDSVALLGTALSAVAFPRIFILAHPVPDTLGDFLAVAALWMFVEQRRDVRWIVPLGLTLSTLVVSHHLSSYFFLVVATGMVVGLELLAPRRWSLRFPVREFVILGTFTAGLFSYWVLYASAFEPILAQGIPGLRITSLPALALLYSLGTIVALVLLALFVHLRRTRAMPRRALAHPRWPSRNKMARDALVLGVLVFGGASLLVFIPIPGTGEIIPAGDVLWFAPFLVLVPLTAGGIGTSASSRLGPVPYAIVVAVFLSAAVSTLAHSQAIPVDRHTEYIDIGIAFVAAIAIGGMAGRVGEAPWRKMAVAAGVACLVGLNAAVAFPPPSLTAGFQEGFTVQDVSLATWSANSLPAGSALAADHRLSDLYFGLSGNPATWDSTCFLFLGGAAECGPASPNVTAAVLSELNLSQAPNTHHLHAIDAVAVDQVMRTTGVALDPSQPALPLNATQYRFFQSASFTLLYENGDQQVWWYLPPGQATA